MASADVDRLLSDLEARRRTALVTGIAVGMGAPLVALLLLAWLNTLEANSFLLDLGKLLLLSSVGGAPVLGFIAYRKIAPAMGVLLWLRRFRGGYGPRLRFHHVLAQACAGMLHPVTIQDASFRVSYLAAAQRWWLVLALGGFVWVVGFILTLFVFAALEILTAESGPGTMLLALGVWTGLFVLGLRELLKRVGGVKLQGQAARVEAANRLQSLQSGRRSNVLGLEILKTDDQVWKAVVSDAMAKADIVLVDITDPTPNILWELQEAVQRLGRERVILAMEEGSHPDLVGSHELGDAFVYPAVQGRPGLGRGTRYHLVAKQLRAEIAARFVRARAARV